MVQVHSEANFTAGSSEDWRSVLNSISMYDLERKRGITDMTSSQGVQSDSEQPGPTVGKSWRQADAAELQRDYSTWR